DGGGVGGCRGDHFTQRLGSARAVLACEEQPALRQPQLGAGGLDQSPELERRQLAPIQGLLVDDLRRRGAGGPCRRIRPGPLECGEWWSDRQADGRVAGGCSSSPMSLMPSV